LIGGNFGLVTVESRSTRTVRADDTRQAILTAAEELFAEHGIAGVSHRQIVTAARQGNNAAVAYHFGTKADLARAIEEKHGAHIEALRIRMIARIGASPDRRDWVACLVRPLTEHLKSLGERSWYARFAAQAMTDPTYQRIIIKAPSESATLHRIAEEIGRGLPAKVYLQRAVMMRAMLMHTCAEFERCIAEGNPSPWPDWNVAADGLVDGIVALMQGPVTPLI
jgi:AcrR family transcriptional regulator